MIKSFLWAVFVFGALLGLIYLFTIAPHYFVFFAWAVVFCILWGFIYDVFFR